MGKSAQNKTCKTKITRIYGLCKANKEGQRFEKHKPGKKKMIVFIVKFKERFNIINHDSVKSSLKWPLQKVRVILNVKGVKGATYP